MEAAWCGKHAAEGPGEPTLNHTSENAALHQWLIPLNCCKAARRPTEKHAHVFVHTRPSLHTKVMFGFTVDIYSRVGDTRRRGDLIKTQCGAAHTCSPAPGWFHVWIRATNGFLGKSPQSNSSLQTLKFISISNPHQLFICNWAYFSCLGVWPSQHHRKVFFVAMIQDTFMNKDCTKISIAGVCSSIQSAQNNHNIRADGFPPTQH